jgi:hypothetical protein
VLQRLEEAIRNLDETNMQDLLRSVVEGYLPASGGPQVAGKDEWQPASRTLH